ncbi:MAG: hypothetical protein JSV23_09755 [Promethearchaeota archaeon]|nr:MAG: hypothetical protein JSV23_09755 [Candidatus Lokiarchaeota archaeon]
MIFQVIVFLQVLADIIGLILLFLMPIMIPIGDFMVAWITAVTQFMNDNFSTNLTIYIIICVVLIVFGVIVNIIWPGDRPGTIFSKGLEKMEHLEDKIEMKGESIEDTVRRCKDCGNPIGDAEVCPLCGARN